MMVALTGDMVYIQPVSLKDGAAYICLRRLSHGFLKPFEPTWSHLELTWRGFLRRWLYARKKWRLGTDYMFFIFCKETHHLVGGINVTNVRYGVVQSARLGYWIGEPFIGRGYMTEAVKLCLDFCFDDLGLNRVEAACLLHNTASERVLLKNHFKQEGVARRYLKINGLFQDHKLFAKVRSSVT